MQAECGKLAREGATPARGRLPEAARTPTETQPTSDAIAESTGGDIQLTRLEDVVARHDPTGAWSEVIISDGRNRVILISGPPGTPPDPHIHPDYN